MPSLCSVDIKMTDAGDEYNKFTSNVNGNGIVFLARQYMDAIAIIDPQDIVDKLKKRHRNHLRIPFLTIW